MIYVDVTSASQSALTTGVKRMQRSLHSFLSNRTDYQPIIWQSVLGRYRLPTASDLSLLEDPFSCELKGAALYDFFLPGLFGDIVSCLKDRSLSQDWLASLSSGDILLAPDLLWDNRGQFFRRDLPEVKRVGIFHDAIALRYPNQSRIDAFCCRRGVKTLSHFDVVVCISQDAERDLHFFWESYGLRPVPTFVIPWPVPFRQERPETTPAFEASEVLYVARLEPYKNHLLLLDACEKLWREGVSLKLRLIGCKAYPISTAKILARVRELQSSGYDLIWKPHVTDEELHEAYRSCSFTAFPSLMEGFGLPILESLWHGRPVICGNTGAVAEVAAGGGCETVDVRDAQSLSASLKRLLTDRTHYERLYRQTQYREYCSWGRYWNLLMKCVSSS